MQEYLDRELTEEKEQELKEHLQHCSACQAHFQELKRTVAFIKSSPHLRASTNFTNDVMARLPKEKRVTGVKRWFRQHPLLVAVSLFMFLMAGSLFNAWNDDQKFAFTTKPNLMIENETVIVPAGEVIEGDLIVKNGNIRIEGKVNGNVTIINGEKYMASAGNVTGEIAEIDKVFEWIWYKVKGASKQVIDLFSQK